MLEIRNLVKDYPLDGKNSVRALQGISLTFPDVQFASILGPSGCGKTTLLNLIGGLDSITSGDILFNYRSLKAMDSKAMDSYRNNRIGFIFQDYFMISTFSILENVMLALTVQGVKDKEAKEKALKALQEVGLGGMEKKKPRQLSGGQQQRAAIARALVLDPSIILADEPTGALDSQASESIMGLLKSLSKTRLVILVTHNEALAKRYSQRLIRLKDGKLESDEMIAPEEAHPEAEPKPERPAKLSLAASLKMAVRNILSKKWKTILTGVANSFGMIGIAFFLALNYGFQNYTQRISQQSASSLPVVVTAYSQNSTTATWSETNASVLYPSTDEIYPSVDTSSATSYTYNNFSSKYFSYLQKLKKEGVIKEIVQSYGNDYSFNLMTDFPDSLNGKNPGGVAAVSTTSYSYNYYASASQLPTNIFHVLYGDLDQYDLLAGSLPQSQNDLVLVVNRYNSVSFNILKSLGFYNSEDTQEDVKDTSLKSKVKPISFTDIIGSNGQGGKSYKVFTNSEYYSFKSSYTVKDGLGHDRTMSTYYRNSDVNQDFYNTNGISLKITGILRPKSTSAFSILSPALCYSSALQDTLAPLNTTSDLAKSYQSDVIFTNPNNSKTPGDDFVNEINAVVSDYLSGDSLTLPTDKVNGILYKYFTFYYPIERQSSTATTAPPYYFTSVNAYLNNARSMGADLIPESFYGVDLTDQKTLDSYLDSFLKDLDSDVTKAYQDILGMIAYMNAYSLVETVVLFPSDLTARKTLLAKLDAFNEVQSGSEDHAANTQEVVKYLEENDTSMIEDIGEVISIVSTILIIFAAVSLTVSCAMTALLTSNNVLERRKEIGLLRSLGVRKKDIAITFEIEAGAIGILAGLLGSLLTYVISFPINRMMNYYYPNYYVGTICDFTWFHLLIVVGISLLIGLISALIPSLKAARENPVSALHSD
jgi:putative ABC transport system permease protein